MQQRLKLDARPRSNSEVESIQLLGNSPDESGDKEDTAMWVSWGDEGDDTAGHR